MLSATRIAAILAVALLLGFETRLAAIGSWLMLVSLHHRVPPILSGAETLMRMLLFWAMFLPLGGAWSADAWRKKHRGNFVSQAQAPVFSIASAAIMLQMAMMYFFSAIAKTNSDWLSGHALARILVHDFYASPSSAWLLQFPGLLRGLTWGTFALEWAAPFLLFFPMRTPWVRLGAIAALAAMHVGIAVSLEVGLFSHVSMAGLTLFIPAEFLNSRGFARFSRVPAVAASVTRPQPSPSFAVQAVCLILFVYTFAVNINSLPNRPLAPLARRNDGAR